VTASDDPVGGAARCPPIPINPIFELLDERGFEVFLVNARDSKHVPGRKTDVSDARWLQRLHSYGLLRASFRPKCDSAGLTQHLESVVGFFQQVNFVNGRLCCTAKKSLLFCGKCNIFDPNQLTRGSAVLAGSAYIYSSLRLDIAGGLTAPQYLASSQE
jgi:hypothetical protein